MSQSPARQSSQTMLDAALRIALTTVALAAGIACNRTAPPAALVVVYTSVDQQFAEKLLAQFEAQTGIRVQPVFDSEAGKTTGLVRRLAREVDAPRCDVWWSSEVFGTIELARTGVLAEYRSPAAADIPDEWKDTGGQWTGTAARARVLAFDPAKWPADRSRPATWDALASADAETLQRFALANPEFGTTRGHVAALWAYWGPDRTRMFLTRLRDSGAMLADGNGHVVRLIAAGAADWGMTDTDDVWVAQGRGDALELNYPTLQLGDEDDARAVALWIPCTTALIRGAPHPAAARRLIDFLLSADAERALQASDSRNVPLRAGLRGEDDPAPAALDFERVADAASAAMKAAREILLR